jgi:undecaprenyl-diphosphatase
MPSRSSRLALGQAVALGLLHGPAELLPISSSGHVALVPWLLGWDYGELDPELRKGFEVALHAGTGAGLLLSVRSEVKAFVASLSPRPVGLLAVSSAPAALAGYLLERPIERRLGSPATIGAALLAGGVAMALADMRPQSRSIPDATVRDALWLGVAQACALFPGVSRTGATLTAARLRGFRRADSWRLSGHLALPVIGGATGLKAFRLRRRGLPEGLAAPFAEGTAASLMSALVASRLISSRGRHAPLWPYAAYRALLATLVFARLTARTGTIER